MTHYLIKFASFVLVLNADASDTRAWLDPWKLTNTFNTCRVTLISEPGADPVDSEIHTPLILITNKSLGLVTKLDEKSFSIRQRLIFCTAYVLLHPELSSLYEVALNNSLTYGMRIEFSTTLFENKFSHGSLYSRLNGEAYMLVVTGVSLETASSLFIWAALKMYFIFTNPNTVVVPTQQCILCARSVPQLTTSFTKCQSRICLIEDWLY
jgi:hypothetical protein